MRLIYSQYTNYETKSKNGKKGLSKSLIWSFDFIYRTHDFFAPRNSSPSTISWIESAISPVRAILSSISGWLASCLWEKVKTRRSWAKRRRNCSSDWTLWTRSAWSTFSIFRISIFITVEVYTRAKFYRESDKTRLFWPSFWTHLNSRTRALSAIVGRKWSQISFEN